MPLNDAQKEIIARRFEAEEKRLLRQQKNRNKLSCVAWIVGMAAGYLSSYFVFFTYQRMWSGLAIFVWAISLAVYLELYRQPNEQNLAKILARFDSRLKIALGFALLCIPWLSRLINMLIAG